MFSVWHFLMWTEIGLHSLYIVQLLVAGCTSVGSEMSLSKHAIFSGARGLSHDLEQLLDFPAELVQLSRGLLLRCARIPY